MGNSLPPPAAFDLISSFARQRGSDIEITLAEPKLDLPASEVPLTLRRGEEIVHATGRVEQGVGGARLIVRLPRSAVSNGRWALSLERADGAREPIAARLLVQGARPLVLLWGARNPKSVEPAPRRGVATRRQGAAVAGRALDRVLTVLPEDKATSVRSNARTIARRVLG